MGGASGPLAGVVGGIAIVVWWVFFSRAAWVERIGAPVLMVLAIVLTRPLLHESVATAGMGFLFFLYVIPTATLALVVWALATRFATDGVRRITLVATLFLACLAWDLVRMDGVTGRDGANLAFRWTPTAEERLLASGEEPPTGSLAMDWTTTAPEWPGFRGPERDGIVHGVRIDTDWSASPPVELWRRPVGPGWSSFAVHGDVFFTQEQRGDREVVSAYRVSTGEPVWKHEAEARFWEANAGAGPRGTPTLHDGRVYTFGATGTLTALDAGDGALLWSRDVAAEAGVEVPYWGFSGSLVVADEIVLVAAAGSLAAFDATTGESVWTSADGGAGYSSPHLLTIDGVAQVVLQGGEGVTSFIPADGAMLWQYPWDGYPIVQPAMTEDGDLLISANENFGVRRISVVRDGDIWTHEDRWTSTGLKPYFNDFVVHASHAYGFDGGLLACISLADGATKWTGGEYGYGQILLLGDQDLLLVLSERGDLALVPARPDGFTELARTAAIEGKTWNHPVLVGDVLLVRNDREMAAFRLAPALIETDAGKERLK